MALNRGEVKESTRTRVLECAKRLNYVPNRIGRTLNTGKSNTIALLKVNRFRFFVFRKSSLLAPCPCFSGARPRLPDMAFGARSIATHPFSEQ